MLQISTENYQKIVAHGLSGKPLEICGLLVGRREGDGAFVDEVYEVDSLDKSELTYSMDGLKYTKVESEAPKRGLELLGIYHTHPATVPYPSVTDVARAHWEGSDDLIFPGFSYLIVSLREPNAPEPRSFKIGGKRIPDDIEEEPVVIAE